VTEISKGNSWDLARISAATRVVAVIGDPVLHSLSPRLHNAAFAQMGLDWVSVGFEVKRGRAKSALDASRSLGLVGLSVTMPHKSDVANLVDSLTEEASKLNAVNCVVFCDDGAIGANTDGAGFIRSIRRGAQFDPEGKRCMVVGSGGAARAITLALANASAREVVVVARSGPSAERCAEIAGGIGWVGTPQSATDMDLVVNATPVGMSGGPVETATPLVQAEILHEGQLVVDVVYEPRTTPWLAAATARGAKTLGGIGMLVHQAELAITLWSGIEPPVSPMWEAVSQL
jgi:shikimate dehydrogenase